MHELKRILVVDNDPDVHRSLAAALKETDFHLENAFDGAAALEKLEGAQWDLIILDVGRPELDGMELLERVRTIRPETQVVVMTLNGAAEKAIPAIRGNAFGWLRKPLVEQAARDMVNSALTSPRLENEIEVLSASPRWLELRLRCNLETATRALDFVRGMEPELPEAEREKLALAFREILFNAVEHGGGNDPSLHVTITYTRANGALLFRVRDPGPGFSFDGLSHAALSNTADAPTGHAINRDELGMRPGGFGILLTRAFVDELLYNEQGNEALLIKYLRPPEVG